MEHSLLHALQDIGLILALSGPIFVLGLVCPAVRKLGSDPERDALAGTLSAGAARWVTWGALAGAVAALLDLFVQSAELQGQTVFGGLNLPLTVRFAALTTVGQLSVWRALVLLLVAAAARTPFRRRWWLVGALGVVALALAGLVSHAAAQPQNRASALAFELTHITAAAVWLGVLFQLLAARRHIQDCAAPPCAALVAEIIRRFSPIALTVAFGLGASGVYGAYRYLHSPGAVLTSAYGLTLVVKLILILPLLSAAWINYRVIRPALLAFARGSAAPMPAPAPAHAGLASDEAKELPAQTRIRPVLQRLGRMLELEVTAGVLVVTVAGILASISPPGPNPALRLSPAQVNALLSPRLPAATVANPATFYGAATRTVDDLRYAEFTHHWSGVFVCLLGLCWLAQAVGGRWGTVGGRLWPLLLVPFAGFIAVASDPEVWFLRRVSLGEALSNPQLLEHQLGAVLVLVLVWLGWRDQRHPSAERPLGYALPVLMILGSLLLLGHAHNNLTETDALTTLINVQHAILGGLGLCAGVLRWLGLRGLLPRGPARLLWPLFVVALGLFMTFVYREVV